MDDSDANAKLWKMRSQSLARTKVFPYGNFTEQDFEDPEDSWCSVSGLENSVVLCKSAKMCANADGLRGDLFRDGASARANPG